MNELKLLSIPVLAAAGMALGAEEAAVPAAVLTPAQEAIFTINNVWVLIGGMLVVLVIIAVMERRGKGRCNPHGGGDCMPPEL